MSLWFYFTLAFVAIAMPTIAHLAAKEDEERALQRQREREKNKTVGESKNA